MIVKNKEQAERFTSNLTDIAIAYYGGGDIVGLLSRCKHRETQGTTVFKIYEGLHNAALKHKKRPDIRAKLEAIIEQLIEHHGRKGRFTKLSNM